MEKKPQEDAAAPPAEKFDRRVWDKELYAKRALERMAAIEAGEDPDRVDPEDAGIFREAPAELPRVPGSQRAFLQTRGKTLNFDAKVGVKQVLPDSSDPLRSGGYYCPVCECSLKDSASYLDHINGKRHQRRLGFSMRVEHSTLDQVKSRLEMHKQKRLREAASAAVDEETDKRRRYAEYEQKMRAAAEEEEAEKAAKKERKKAKKAAASGTAGADSSEEEGGVQEGGVKEEGEEEDIAAIMGFGGFGGSKKT